MTDLKTLLFILAFGATYILASTEKQCISDTNDECSGFEDISEETYINKYGVPEGWEEYDLDDFWEVFDCDDLFRSSRPIHDESTWMFLRGAYLGVVGLEKSSIDKNIYGDGFAVPYKVGQMPGKGRGVIAAGEVKEGTLIYEDRFKGCFESQYDYRHFLVTIPSDLACDVIQWAYVETRSKNESEEDDIWLCCDFDAGGIMNTGVHDFVDFEIFEARKRNQEAEQNNVEIRNSNLFAMRDINEGEEFLVDYAAFAVVDGEKRLGYQ